MREVHGWRRVRRWIGASALGVVAFVVLAAIGFVIMMQTGWGRELVRRQVEAKLAATFVGGAKIGAIEGTPFTDIVVHDLVIDGPDGKPAIKVGALRLNLGLLPLISHQLVLSKLVADDVDVLLDRDRDGDLRIKRLMKPGPASTWNVRLPTIEVHRAHVMIDTGKETVDLDDIQIDGNVKLPHGGPIDVAASISAKWRQKDAPIDISAVLHADATQIHVPSALVRIADVEVAAGGVRIPRGRGAVVAGTLAVSAPAATVTRLAPEVDLPVDVALAVEAQPIGSETALAISGAIGGAPLRGFAHADLRAKHATGFISAANVDLFAITRGGFDGLAGAVAAFEVAPAARDEELPRARAMVQAWSERGDIPRIDLIAAVDSARDHARVALGATGAAGLLAAADISIAKHANAITLERALVIAHTRDPARATGGKTPVHGALDLNVTASGALTPHPDLAIAGHVDGRAVRFRDLSAASIAVRVDARHLPAQPIGTARVELVDLARGDLQLGKLTVAAGNRPDRKIQVSVRSQPKQAPWLVDLDALVTPGETVGIDLQRHFVRAAGGATWRGNTGHIAIGPREISLRDLRSTSEGGNFAVDATYARDTGDLRAKLAAALDLSNIKDTMVGRLDATVDVERAAARWRGDARVKASGVSISQIALDADAKLEARGGRVTLDATAGSTRAGHAKIAADVAAPIDLANARAWRSLTRTALRSIDVQLDGVDLQSVAKLAHTRPITGRVDGKIEIKSGETRGDIHVRGLRGDEIRNLGELAADLKLEPHGRDELDAQATAQVQALGSVALGARVATPERVLDPGAWKRLGVGALRGAWLRTGEIAFEPGTLEKLGLVTNFRGRAKLDAEVGPALETAKVTLDVSRLRGGVIAMPVNAHFEANADRKDTRATIAVHANGIQLVDVHATVPVALDRLRTAARSAPLHATVELPNVDARKLAAVLGNTQVAGGTIDGKIEVAGTVAKPTATAAIVARDVAVPPGIEGAKVTPMMHELKIDGTWDGTAAALDITGTESSGGTLHVVAKGAPSAPAEVTATLDATKLELAPLVAFLPGPAGGLGGRLEAKLSVQGVDPKTAQIAGNLRVTEGRIPIAPQVGTLFHGDVSVNVQNHMVAVAAQGKLGSGSVKLVGNAPLDGAAPTGGQAKLTVRKVKLIGTTEPVIDGDFAAKVARGDDGWHAEVKVTRANVVIPEEKGDKLAPAGAPADLVYAGRARHHPPTQVNDTPPHRKPPDHPTLVADIELGSTKVESKELRGNVAGKLQVTVGGDEVGIVGNLWLDHGDLDLFDRRYQIERAALHFDGSTDPILDVEISYDFPDVTTITQVRGRASKPELLMSSRPGIYSQAELLGFLLGGEPNGDPNNAPSASQRVTAAGTSYVANMIGGYVRKALPIDVDVLRYESATSSSSAAVTVGTWITHELFLAWRQRLAARPDENAGEGEIEYWLRRRLVLAGTVGDRGVNGIDLLWRRRW
jgi:hypothetical protein